MILGKHRAIHLFFKKLLYGNQLQQYFCGKTSFMKYTFLIFVASLAACNPSTEHQGHAAQPPAETPEARVAHGKYLVEIMGCGDCHSPKIMTPQGPAPDPARLLSGHPAAEKIAPFPDPKTAYNGQWALFSPGLTIGVGPGASIMRPTSPPMTRDWATGPSTSLKGP